MDLEVQKGSNRELESAQNDLHKEMNALANKVSML